MLWFTADTHFGHAALVTYGFRKFQSVDVMDAYILSRLNSCVRSSDTLYHLGDFAWTGRWREYRDLIACQTIHFIVGNHDSSKQLKSAIRDGIFASVSYYTRIKQRNGIRAILCHYPIHSWQPGFVHLHGHSHGMMPEIPGRKDVGVDAQSFSPVSEGLVLEMPLRPEDDGRHTEREPANETCP